MFNVGHLIVALVMNYKLQNLNVKSIELIVQS